MTLPAAAWDALTAELDLWDAEGRTAYFWWRDDDAVAATPALDRLLALQAEHSAPLALAVIPALVQDSLPARLAGESGVVALQHGYAHRNHAAPNEKKSEFPASRPLADRIADLTAGQTLAHSRFGSRLMPVFVPPWNRLGADCLPELAGLGLRAVSSFQPRPAYWAASGLAWLNTHIDPIDWHGDDHQGAAARGLGVACTCLRAMRQGVRPPEALGLLTHHLRHDEAIWAFTAAFLGGMAGHPAVRWLDAASALGIGATADPGAPAVSAVTRAS